MMRNLLCSMMVLAACVQASADPMDSLFANSGEACLPAVKVNLKDAIRNGIEGEVKRREQALKMPAPLAGLSCLDSLMDVNLDTAIQLPSLNSLFNGALSDAQNQVCSMARDQIEKVTEPLQNAFSIPPIHGLNLPGTGANGGPDIDFGVSNGAIGRFGAEIVNTGPRENAQTIMDELYRGLYGGAM